MTIEDYQKKYTNLPFEQIQVQYRRKKILEIIDFYSKRFSKPLSFLEIGCGTDPLFQYIPKFQSFSIIEAANDFYVQAENQKQFHSHKEKIKIYHDYLRPGSCQKYIGNNSFDFIVVSSLLHEVENPDEILNEIKSVCHENTILHVNVPNALSLHRLLAVEMGILENPYQKTPTQKKLNQHNTFDLSSLKELAKNSGFKVLEEGSFFLKPFSHAQMQNLIDTDFFSKNHLDAFYSAVKYMPEFGSEIFLNLSIN